jgi:hypothetical protein
MRPRHAAIDPARPVPAARDPADPPRHRIPALRAPRSSRPLRGSRPFRSAPLPLLAPHVRTRRCATTWRSPRSPPIGAPTGVRPRSRRCATTRRSPRSRLPIGSPTESRRRLRPLCYTPTISPLRYVSSLILHPFQVVLQVGDLPVVLHLCDLPARSLPQRPVPSRRAPPPRRTGSPRPSPFLYPYTPARRGHFRQGFRRIRRYAPQRPSRPDPAEGSPRDEDPAERGQDRIARRTRPEIGSPRRVVRRRARGGPIRLCRRGSARTADPTKDRSCQLHLSDEDMVGLIDGEHVSAGWGPLQSRVCPRGRPAEGR